MRWLRVASPEPMSGKASEIKLPQGNSSGTGLKTIISEFVERIVPAEILADHGNNLRPQHTSVCALGNHGM